MEPSLYGFKDAAAVLGVDEARLRRWVRSGIVSPSEKQGRRRCFSFEDLIAAKAAKELLDGGVSERAVRRSLGALRASLPAVGRPLSRLRLVSDGERLAVIGDDVAFEPLSGQLVMDFVVGALSRRAAEVMALPPRRRPIPPVSSGKTEALGVEDGEPGAWGLFRHACALEELGRADEAEAMLRRALDRDPRLAAAHNNLGNLAYRRGQRGEARERYEQALALDPDQPEARYNLANLLDVLGEHDRARAEWTRVAALAPGFADAHYNLALAEARAGSSTAARASLERYLRLDGQGSWAEAAHRLLAQLERPGAT